MLWNCKRYETFQVFLGGTYKRFFISHSISCMGRCFYYQLEFSQVYQKLYLLVISLLSFDHRYVERKTYCSIRSECHWIFCFFQEYFFLYLQNDHVYFWKQQLAIISNLTLAIRKDDFFKRILEPIFLTLRLLRGFSLYKDLQFSCKPRNAKVKVTLQRKHC